MITQKLFMVLLGCRPAGRNTEQHDVFFGIAPDLKALIPSIKKFWKGSGNIHIDGWRIVHNVDGYAISVVEKVDVTEHKNQLFFLNLGGYKENYFEEFHYKMLTVARDKNKAIATAKQSAFYLHTGFGLAAKTHIDDKYGVDVDDIFEIKEILTDEMKANFSIIISEQKNEHATVDAIQLGYFPLASL